MRLIVIQIWFCKDYEHSRISQNNNFIKESYCFVLTLFTLKFIRLWKLIVGSGLEKSKWGGGFKVGHYVFKLSWRILLLVMLVFFPTNQLMGGFGFLLFWHISFFFFFIIYYHFLDYDSWYCSLSVTPLFGHNSILF